MTIDELADEISIGLPKYQRQANYEFLCQVHKALKGNGAWYYPEAMRMFKKEGEGFREIILESYDRPDN